MKRTAIYFILAIMVAFWSSCDDNTNFSNPHTLTDEEIAEIARQDSVARAEKERINADLILRYKAEVTTSKTLYDGVVVPISIDSIATLFGLTNEQVLAGIAEDAGAPDIKKFAIDWTTRADYGTGSTTGSIWGHWWDVDGNVTEWGSTTKLAMTFAEFDTSNGSFNVGQFPNRLVPNDTIQVIECLKYNEKRVAVVINITAAAPGQITGTIVRTQNLTTTVVAQLDWADADSLLFDRAQALSDLGVSSMDDVKFIGVNADGSYDGEAVTGNGFWYNAEGFVGAYEDDGVVYTNYGDWNEDYIGIGQYPSGVTDGQSITLKYGLLANNKIVMLNIVVNVIAYPDPETAPSGDPETLSASVTLSQAYNNTYSSVSYDVKDILRNAFKMTTYQIHKAIADGTLKLYQGAVTEAAPTYTSDVPGYWLKADGSVCEWSEGIVWMSLGHSETELYLYGGNHPDNAVTGNTVTTTYIATCNGGSVTFNLTYNVQ